jgi:hypothetical protein
MQLEAYVPESALTITMDIPSSPKLLLESSVLLAAHQSKQSKIKVTCSTILTLRAFFKVVEYCWYSPSPSREQEEPSTITSSLGIFGQPYLEEVQEMARYFDLPFLLTILKEVRRQHIFG